MTKYPQAAGAALYTHKAFGVHFFTFIVCFIVMTSGITSASTASRAFAVNLSIGFGISNDNVTTLLVALAFIVLIMLVNLRGVTESVWLNVVLTLVELSGLLLVIFIGLWADLRRQRQLVPGRRLRDPGGQRRPSRRQHGDLPGLLRDGRLRGLGEHGRGDQGP